VTIASVGGGSCSTSRQSYDPRCDRCLNVGTWRRQYQSTKAAFSLPSAFVCWISLLIFCSPSDEQLDQEDLPRNVPRQSFYTALISQRRRISELSLSSGGNGVGGFGSAWRGSGPPNAGRRALSVRARSTFFGGGRISKAGPLRGPDFSHEFISFKMWAHRAPASARRVFCLPVVIRPGKRCIRGASLQINNVCFVYFLNIYTIITIM